MKVAVFGATGFLGRALVGRALERGLEVRALARTPSKLGPLESAVEVVQGDYLDEAATREVLRGTDAVLSTAGPPMGRSHGVTPEDFERAMQTLVRQMEAEGIRRIVNVGSLSVRVPGEHVSGVRRLMRGLTWLIAPVMTAAKERELAVLSGSGLDWTTVRVPRILPDAEGALEADATDSVGLRVDVSQLADFMLDALDGPTWVERAPFVATQAA